MSLTAFEPVLGHLAVLYGQLVKIVSGPLAVEVDRGGDTLESLRVQPFDAFGKRADMCPRDGAEGGGAELHEPRDILFDVLETPGIVDVTACDVVMVRRAVERKE